MGLSQLEKEPKTDVCWVRAAATLLLSVCFFGATAKRVTALLGRIANRQHRWKGKPTRVRTVEARKLGFQSVKQGYRYYCCKLSSSAIMGPRRG